MQSYRFYLLDHDEHIKAVETISCASDAEAAAKAAALLEERPGFASIEVWKGKVRVHLVRRG